MITVKLHILGEICPSCGGFVQQLDPISGWCETCIRTHRKKNCTYLCERCSNEFKSRTARPFCAVCRRLNWLEHHADEIEEYIEKGLDFEAAKEEVRSDTKPICLGCNAPLPKNGFFCTKPECRKLYDKFRRLKDKGMSEEEALKEII
jgi:hypothetical protein